MLFRVLGPVEITGPESVIYIRARKPRTLLAVLLLKANAWVSVDELMDAIWPDQSPPAAALRNIGTYVWQLRKTLPPLGEDGRRIESRPGAYLIRLEPGERDIEEFEALLTSGTDALAGGEAARAADTLKAAVDLWRGTPFEGLATDAAQPEIARLTELHWIARERLADALIATRQLPEAIALCAGLTTEDPLREGPWAKLLTALRKAGRTADALAAYQRVRATLVDELGTEPGPELRRIHQSLLSDDDPDATDEKPEPAPAPAEPAPAGAATGPESSDDYVRAALDAAGALSGSVRSDSFSGPAAALRWFEAERANLIAAIEHGLADGSAGPAWQLASALHEYAEAGGELADWPQLLARVAAATSTAGDRYGELVARNALGIAHTRAGQLADACTEFVAARGMAAALGDAGAEGVILVNLATAEADAGAGDVASGHLRQALPLLDDPAAEAAARQMLTDLAVPPTAVLPGAVPPGSACSAGAAL